MADNTIALLSNICKKLDTISQQIQSSNKPKAQADAVQKSVINNKTTGLNTVSNVPKPNVKPIQPTIINNVIKQESEKGAKLEKSEKLEKSAIDKNISIKDITNFLGTLPASVQAVTKLHGITIKRFENVLNKLSSSIVNFADKLENTKMTDTSAKKYKMIIDSISTLSSSVKKVSLMAPLIPLFDLSLLMLMPGIKLLAKVFDTFSKIKDSKAALNGITAINNLIKGMGIIVASSIAMAIAIKVFGVGEILKGIGLVLGIVTALSVLALVIAGVSAHVKLADIGLHNITRFIASMLAITAATMVLGAVIGLGMPLLVAGFAGVLAVMTAYSAVALTVAFVGSLIGGIEKFGVLNSLTKFIAWNLAFTAATMVLGVFIAQGWEYTLAGLVGVSIITAGYGVLAIRLTALAAKLEVTEKTGVLMQIAKFEVACLGIAFGTILLGYMLKNHIADTIAGFTLMAGVIIGTYEVAKLSQKLGAEVSTGAKGLFEISKFMAMCGAVATEIILIGEGIKLVGSGKIWEAFGLFTAIAVEGAALAMLANKFKSQTEKGAAAFTPIALMMTAAGGVLLATITTLKIKKDNNIAWLDILAALGMMGLIVVEFGALAIAASLVFPQVVVSLPALAAIGLLAAGSMLVLGGVVAITSYALKHIGDDWGIQSIKTLGLMGLVVAEFGVLALAAFAATVPILLGTPALAIVEGFAFASVGLLNRIVDLQVKMNKNNLTTDSINLTIGTIKSAIQGFVDLVKGISFGGFIGTLNVMAKGAALSMLMNQVAVMASALGSIALIATPDGKIRPAKFTDDKIVVGEPVDIIASGTIIISAIKQFTSLITKEFKDISLKDMVRAMFAMKAIGVMLDPISNFTNALMSFDSSDGTTLHTVKITDDGKVITGPDVHLPDVANLIAKAISTFAGTLFSRENAEIWDNMIHGSTLFRKSNVQKAMGIFATVVEPVCTFVDTISKFTGNGDGKTLTIIEFDENGKEKYRKNIDVISVSSTIANAVTNFAKELSSHGDIWDQMMSGRFWPWGKGKTGKAMGVFASIVDPISKFVEILTKFSVSNGEIKVIDSKGVEHSTNLVELASKISEAVTTFALSISNIDPSQFGGSNIVAGVLNSTVNPINDFVSLMSKYSGQPNGVLPILNEKGEVIETVDILATTNNIVNCTTAFKESILELQGAFDPATSNIELGASIISKNVKTLVTAVADKKTTSNLNKFADLIKKDTTSLKDFDDVLSNGNKKRIQSIKELSKAVEELANKVERDSIKKLSDLFTALSNVKSGDVAQVVEELKKIGIGTGGSGGGGGTSQNVIIEAIKKAVADMDIDLSFDGVTIQNKDKNGQPIGTSTISGWMDGVISSDGAVNRTA